MAALLSLSQTCRASRAAPGIGAVELRGQHLEPFTSMPWPPARRPATRPAALERREFLLERLHLVEHLRGRASTSAGAAFQRCRRWRSPCLRATAGGDQRVVAVTASTRRTPAATPLSATILNTPMSPVRCTCVPPHSSRLEPMSSTHLVAVLLAEQHHRAGPRRHGDGHHAFAGGVGEDLGVDDGLDLRDLRFGHRRVVREVEARALGST